MTNLIKNQILKHLSKFAKNLSLDKLHLSTLKGHGELNNLELDEEVLTELLELPAWVRLTCATCNHVTLKIHWTKLKSVPISLSLDEVIVALETCEDLRPPTPLASDHRYYTGGKYGFSDRVIDGMTVVANSVHINFHSPAFQASFQLSRVVLESYSPDWKKKDVRLSRIKDIDRDELLLFKRLDWQVLRVEAKSRESDVSGVGRDIPITPLRLITNQGCCKMTMKKKLSDCTVVGSRLVFVFDDLLWVLTDAQLVAALHFLKSLSGLVQKATQLSQKRKAKKKLEQQPEQKRHHQHSKSSHNFSPVFHRNDVVETSYHVLCSCLDLHLCDDMDPQDGRSQYPELKGGGALQVSLRKLVADFYPYHRTFASREHWLRYTEPSSSHNAWVQQLLSIFYEHVQEKGCGPFMQDPTTGESPKFARSRADSVTSTTAVNENTFESPTSPDGKTSQSRKTSTTSSSSDPVTSGGMRKSSTMRKLPLQQSYRYLMSSCTVLRLEDIVAYKVSTSSTSRKQAIEKFLIYNKNAHLPSDIKTLHLEHTTYYLPGDLDYPVPSPNLCVYVGPLKLFMDTVTVLWMNAFYLNLYKCLSSMDFDTQECPSVLNIRIEALMPQIVISSDKQSPAQPERPKTMHVQASRIIATNCRVGDHSTFLHLSDCLEILNSRNLPYDTTQFPWHPSDKKPVSEAFMKYLLEKNLDGFLVRRSSVSSPTELASGTLDIWSIHLDPVWAEFTSRDAGRARLQSFIDPLLITLWFYNSDSNSNVPDCLRVESVNDCVDSKLVLPGLKPMLCQNSNGASADKGSRTEVKRCNRNENESDMYLLMHIHSLLNIQLTHFQYLFVLRVLDQMSEITDYVTLDTATIMKDKPISSLCVTTWLARIEVSLILKNLNQSSATSDSADLASLQEDGSSNSTPAPSKHRMVQSQSSFSIDENSPFNKGINEQSITREKSCSSIIEDCCMDSGIPKSCSDSVLNCHSSSHSLTTAVPSSCANEQRDLPTSDLFQGSLQSGTSAVKRGFTSLVASIDSAFTKDDPRFPDGEACFLDDDSLSLRSDHSSDLDQFIIVSQDGSLDDEFFHHPECDAAVEAKEESISNYTLNSEKKKEMISVTIFKLDDIAVVVQSCSSICCIMKCSKFHIKEDAAVSWENFQNTFSSRSRAWKAEKKSNLGSNSELSLRFTRDSSSMTQGNLESDPGFLKILGQNHRLQLFMSSVPGLVEFFEDEIVVKPLPFRIVLQNLQIIMQDDSPTATLSSNPVPLNINLPGCILEKTADGTLSVLPLPQSYVQDKKNVLLQQATHEKSHAVSLGVLNLSTLLHEGKLCYCRTSDTTASAHVHDDENVFDASSSCDILFKEKVTVHRLLKENEELKCKLAEVSNLRCENELLKDEIRKLKSTCGDEYMRRQLADSESEVRRLEEEKGMLQETLKFLQEEMKTTEKERYRHGTMNN